MYDFDLAADRENMGNMKDFLTPQKLKEKGIPSFSAAEMDFRTAPSVIRSVTETVQKGVYGFTIPTPRYRQAVCWWMEQMRNWKIQADWIVPVLGTIYSVATAIRMTTEKGEGIIVQTPVYYRYEQAADRLERKTVHNPLKIVNGKYEMDFEDLERKMADPRNKLLVLCNAHNPVGRVWTRQELERVGQLSEKYKVTVICDEIFGEMTFDGHTAVPYGSLDVGREYAITVVSLGKAFNFTGVNHANVLIPDANLRERYEKQKYADHYGSMGPFEYASVLGAYCQEGKEWFLAVRDYIQENAHEVKAFFEKYIPQAYVFPIEGSSVCWIDWSFLGLRGEKLHDFLTEKALFEVETGEIYAGECSAFTRMNLSSQRRQIRTALCRVRESLKNIDKML